MMMTMMDVPFRNCSVQAALNLTQVRSRADDKYHQHKSSQIEHLPQSATK